MNEPLTRRNFLHRTALASAAFWVASRHSSFGKGSANDKLNVGFIGVANRAGADLHETAQLVESVNVAALCDVDEVFLAKAKQEFPSAKAYNDYRRLLEQKDLDAIVIGTPDHTHAVAAAAALRGGRHVYCEKPLTRTVSEARVLTKLAQQRKLATQIGTQIHAGTNYRRVVELVQSGAVGTVREVHVWSAAVYGGKNLPIDIVPVPKTLHYDLWLGPVLYRPYHPEWVPFKWRNWWAFGGGALADFGCHYMDLPHWALNLSHPLTVEVVDGPPVHPESTPPWLIVRYEHPARGPLPPVRLTWYHGGRQPELLTEEQKKKWRSGVLFIGEKGNLLADYGRRVLLPETDFAGFKAPEAFIPDSVGHHKEWVEACKNGGSPTCSFDYSGPLTETALLGNVAYRAGSKLEWDWEKMVAGNCPAASQYIQHQYRKGWLL